MTTPLKPCRECGHLVSKSARTCPNCGVSKPAKNGSINRIILALIFGWLVWFYVIDPIMQGYKDRQDHLEELRLKNEAQAIRESPLSNKAEQQ
ncbi:MAG: zinc ribbon domain-containing protein [Methylobacter sp.]